MTDDPEYRFLLSLRCLLEDDELHWKHETRDIEGFVFIRWHRFTNNGVSVTFKPSHDSCNWLGQFWEVIISSEGVDDTINRIEGRGELFTDHLMNVLKPKFDERCEPIPEDKTTLIKTCLAKLSKKGREHDKTF